MDRLRKLTPTHVALCALVLAAAVVLLILGAGLAGIMRGRGSQPASFPSSRRALPLVPGYLATVTGVRPGATGRARLGALRYVL